jgi:hypothetical protein
LFDAINQHPDGKRFDQIFHFVLVEEERDRPIGRETGDEYEPIGQRWPQILRLQ